MAHFPAAAKNNQVVLHRRAQIALDSLTEQEHAAVIKAIDNLSLSRSDLISVAACSSHEGRLYKTTAGRDLRILFSMAPTGELLILDILHRASLDYIRLLSGERL
jgi:hypothetical protein